MILSEANGARQHRHRCRKPRIGARAAAPRRLV